MVIRVYYADHDPPHLHVQYGEFDAIVEIRSGRILNGTLPPRVRRLFLEWLFLRKREVLKAWGNAQKMKAPGKIRPLD